MTQTNKYYRFDGMKAVSLWGDEGWVTSNGSPAMELSDLVNHVPWLYRAVELVADRASTVPFAIVNKSGNDIDSSADYANAVGYMPQPRRLFDQLARALTVYGYAYALKVRNTARVLNVRYLIPTSVEVIWDENGTVIGYTRNLGTRKIQYTPDDVIAFWPASEQVEIGPPPSSPVIAAAQAAGVCVQDDRPGDARQFFADHRTAPPAGRHRARAGHHRPRAGGQGGCRAGKPG